MTQPFFALLRHSLRVKRSQIRRYYYKLSGLQLGSNVLIGKISCDWPKNIRIGADCTIQDGVRFHIASPFSNLNRIEIGDRVFIGQYCEFNCNTRIVIGNDTKIAARTTIVDVSHESSRAAPINKQPVIEKEILIGDDVWIGTGCIILKGVTIGNGSIIGAGSLVNKSIPEFQVWAGSPARFIRNRE